MARSASPGWWQRLRRVDRDLRDADLEALLEGVDLERLVQEVGRLLLELHRRALEDGRAVVAVDLKRLQRAAVEEEQRRVGRRFLAVHRHGAGQDRLARID